MPVIQAAQSSGIGSGILSWQPELTLEQEGNEARAERLQGPDPAGRWRRKVI